jgi:hypothetical protein
MKTVFNSNSELSHAWANNLSNYGRTKSMFFENDSIYSYGYHFLIAKKFEDLKLVLINSNGYSSSTGKHINHVYYSISDEYIILRVPFHQNKFGNFGEVVKKLSSQIDDCLKQQLNARSNTFGFIQALLLRSTLVSFCSIFELELPTLPENWDQAKEKFEALNSQREQITEAKKLKSIEKQKENLQKWLNRDYNLPLYELPIYLRYSIDGSIIETSHGAKVSKLEALKLLSKFRSGQDIIGEQIGGFKILSIDSDKIKIGCHVIEWNTINNFI